MTAATLYVTTPIYYVNDRPHIGHLYTTTICDVYARFQRLSGHDVFFLTGTDEHGIKVEKSATRLGVEPQALADENSAVFRDVMKRFDLTHDHFLRTTDPEHERQVQAFVEQLLASDDIYLGEFEGWYDEGQEEYHTESGAKELEYVSPVSGRPLVRAKEKNYYFRLSAYQERIEQLFESQPDFVRPGARRNEMLGRLREGLQDIPVSRTNFSWGVPMPGDPTHVIYVWIDALFNYATALGLAEPDGATFARRGRYWPATCHVIGKEILWFHSVIWPAILMALDLPLPKGIYAHSFWICEGKKMSKSLGNFIDLPTIDRYVDRYGLDAFRWYLATQGPLGATDTNFAAEHFHEIYTTDLVNTVGNCASRVATMVERSCEGVVPAGDGDPGDWPERARQAVQVAEAAMDRFDLATACTAGIDLVRAVDSYINATEPWRLAKEPGRQTEVGIILHHCLEAIRIASLLLWPVLPGRMALLWRSLGCPIDPSRVRLDDATLWGGSTPGTPVEKIVLFPRLEGPLPQLDA